MCFIHLTVPDLLSGRCDSDESEGQMRSQTKEGGQTQDWVLMLEGERRTQ